MHLVRRDRPVLSHELTVGLDAYERIAWARALTFTVCAGAVAVIASINEMSVKVPVLVFTVPSSAIPAII